MASPRRPPPPPPLPRSHVLKKEHQIKVNHRRSSGAPSPQRRLAFGSTSYSTPDDSCTSDEPDESSSYVSPPQLEHTPEQSVEEKSGLAAVKEFRTPFQLAVAEFRREPHLRLHPAVCEILTAREEMRRRALAAAWLRKVTEWSLSLAASADCVAVLRQEAAERTMLQEWAASSRVILLGGLAAVRVELQRYPMPVAWKDVFGVGTSAATGRVGDVQRLMARREHVARMARRWGVSVPTPKKAPPPTTAEEAARKQIVGGSASCSNEGNGSAQTRGGEDAKSSQPQEGKELLIAQERVQENQAAILHTLVENQESSETSTHAEGPKVFHMHAENQKTTREAEQKPPVVVVDEPPPVEEVGPHIATACDELAAVEVSAIASPSAAISCDGEGVPSTKLAQPEVSNGSNLHPREIVLTKPTEPTSKDCLMEVSAPVAEASMLEPTDCVRRTAVDYKISDTEGDGHPAEVTASNTPPAPGTASLLHLTDEAHRNPAALENHRGKEREKVDEVKPREASRLAEEGPSFSIPPSSAECGSTAATNGERPGDSDSGKEMKREKNGPGTQQDASAASEPWPSHSTNSSSSSSMSPVKINEKLRREVAQAFRLSPAHHVVTPGGNHVKEAEADLWAFAPVVRPTRLQRHELPSQRIAPIPERTCETIINSGTERADCSEGVSSQKAPDVPLCIALGPIRYTTPDEDSDGAGGRLTGVASHRSRRKAPMPVAVVAPMLLSSKPRGMPIVRASTAAAPTVASLQRRPQQATRQPLPSGKTVQALPKHVLSLSPPKRQADRSSSTTKERLAAFAPASKTTESDGSGSPRRPNDGPRDGDQEDLGGKKPETAVPAATSSSFLRRSETRGPFDSSSSTSSRHRSVSSSSSLSSLDPALVSDDED
jgi:hypothetical protein